MFTNDSYRDLLQNNLGVGVVGVLGEDELMEVVDRGCMLFSP